MFNPDRVGVFLGSSPLGEFCFKEFATYRKDKQ